jgi:hypothetical protein
LSPKGDIRGCELRGRRAADEDPPCTRSRREAREVLTGLNYPVTKTEIPLAE